MNIPLAERMRPHNLEQFVGQKKLIGKQGTLRKVLDRGLVPSLLLWGPPGVGKTTLAEIIARKTGRKFFTLSAINAGVKDVRAIIEKAKEQSLFSGSKTPLLFIDEIHRFSKSQQDSLLGAVERGHITLIGATTENPSFEVISALLSRCQVYTLESLNKEQLEGLLNRALEEDAWLQEQKPQLTETNALLRYSGGDARKLLNHLELVVSQAGKEAQITDALTAKILQTSPARYDKSGEQHYDIISAFIKSIRGSDPNAGVYWLARMIEGGEEPKFIARRLLILASEDVGLANPNALLLAHTTFDAVVKIGWPESRIILSQCVIYLANSPKSNSAYMAINEAQAEVKNSGDAEVPLHLRNAPTALMKEMGYGLDYRYAHDYQGNFVEQEYLPKPLTGKAFYKPGKNPNEEKTRVNLQKQWPHKYGY